MTGGGSLSSNTKFNCENVAGQQGCERGGWGSYSVGSHYQTTNEIAAD
jgi:hypothetical protein